MYPVLMLNWNEVPNHNKTNGCCNTFTFNASNTVNKFLKKQKQVRKTSQLPWFLDDIPQLMKKRDYALKTHELNKY